MKPGKSTHDAPGPAPDPGRRTAKFDLRSRLVLAATVLIALVLVTDVLDILHTRTRVLEGTERDLSNLARVLASDTANVFSRVDLALADAETLSTRRNGSALSSGLRREIAASPEILALAIYDERGRRVAFAGDAHALPVNARNAPFFNSSPSAPAAGTAIDIQPLAIDGGAPRILMSRRSSPAGAGSARVAVAATDPAYFNRFFEAIRLGHGAELRLIRRDGLVIARRPSVTAPGSGRGDLGLPADATARKMPANLDVVSPGDHLRRLVALDDVPGFPLVVGVGVARDTALPAWRQQMVHTLVGTVLLSGTIAGLLIALLRTFAHRDASEAKLRESEERYALAMAGSNEGHWDCDLKNSRVYLSARLQALIGKPAEDSELAVAEVKAYVQPHPDDAVRAHATLTAHLAGRTPHFETELRVRRADGSWRWMRVRGLALRDKSGHAFRMSGSAADISERKAAEDEKARLESRLRQAQKMEAIGTMAGGIAHDFNNILGAILGYGEMALTEAAEGSPQKRHIANVMTAAQRAKKLVQQILTYSRSHRGRSEPVLMKKVVLETLDLIRASMPKSVALDEQIDPGDAYVVGDPTHLHQLLMNLCSNAIDAMKAGGRLTVRLHAADEPIERMLSHGVLAPGRYVCVTVQDTGTGIEPDLLDRIFEPFFTTKAPGSGTGLGLALVHGIVSDLRGSIDVRSTAGGGTTFDVYIPRTDPALQQEPAALHQTLHGHGERVMFVDDEKTLVLLGEEMLAALGYEPAGYERAADALHALNATPGRFDAVVTDSWMPQASGIEIARATQAIRPNLPVILVSSYRGPLLEQEAEAAGVSALLTKPLAADALANALAQALQRT